MSNELPSNWAWTTVGEAFDVIFGQSPPSSTYNDIRQGLPFFQGKAEFSDKYAIVKKWCNSPKKTAEKDDVLLSIRAPVGPTNLCPEKVCIGRGLAAIRGVAGVSPLFIFYLLKSNEHSIANMSTGTTFGAITSNVLQSFPIPFPPLNEQRRIVSRIEKLFTQLDEGVRSLQKAQIKLEQYKQAVMGDIFNPQKKWELGKISDIGNVSGGITKNSNKKEYDIILPYLRVANVQSNRLELSEIKKIGVTNKEVNKLLLKKNDILIVEGNTREEIGRVSIWNDEISPCIHQNHIIKIRLYEGNNAKFILYWLLSQKSREYIMNIVSSTSASLYTLSLSKVEKIPVPICSIDEQNSIVETIDLLLQYIQLTNEDLNKSIRNISLLRNNILEMAFKGKLVLQDPLDEPASALLEKIKSTKGLGKISRGQRRLD